jgi:hypothetical protein
MAVGERHRRRYVTNSVTGATHAVVDRHLRRLLASDVPKPKATKSGDAGLASLAELPSAVCGLRRRHEASEPEVHPSIAALAYRGIAD